ncbi:MAG: (2Fe-2S)-binding protein [Bacillota bacterium]
MRVLTHPVLGPAPEAKPVRFSFNGRPVEGREGEPIAAALLAAGIKTLRRTCHTDDPRGLYCGIGHCFECRVTVNGEGGIRSCLTPVAEGMRVESEPPAVGQGSGGDGDAGR